MLPASGGSVSPGVPPFGKGSITGSADACGYEVDRGNCVTFSLLVCGVLHFPPTHYLFFVAAPIPFCYVGCVLLRVLHR